MMDREWRKTVWRRYLKVSADWMQPDRTAVKAVVGACHCETDCNRSSGNDLCQRRRWSGNLYGISGKLKRRIDMDRILIVEDDELIAELEQDYLLVEGMESDIVANGAEAVRRFREREYSAVLLDLMLPGEEWI